MPERDRDRRQPSLKLLERSLFSVGVVCLVGFVLLYVVPRWQSQGDVRRFQEVAQFDSESRPELSELWALASASSPSKPLSESSQLGVSDRVSPVATFGTVTAELAEARPVLATNPPETKLWSVDRLSAFVEAVSFGPRDPIAILRVPGLGLEVPVYEGVDEGVLNRGAGRIPGTAHFGDDSNVGVAAHRDGYFRALKDIVLAAEIEVVTLEGTRIYQVDHMEIVKPDAVHVLGPSATSRLTLVTCYPFYFVGDAPQRFIVHAQEISSDGHRLVRDTSSS